MNKSGTRLLAAVLLASNVVTIARLREARAARRSRAADPGREDATGAAITGAVASPGEHSAGRPGMGDKNPGKRRGP